MFDRRAPDVVIEAAGAKSAFDIAVELVRLQGRIAHVSLARDERIGIDLHELLRKEIEVLNLLSYPHTAAPALGTGERP